MKKIDIQNILKETRILVIDQISKNSPEKIEAGEIGNTTGLVSLGLLDSFSMFDLISALEDHFKVKIEAHHLINNKFENIESIANLIYEELNVKSI